MHTTKTYLSQYLNNVNAENKKNMFRLAKYIKNIAKTNKVMDSQMNKKLLAAASIIVANNLSYSTTLPNNQLKFNLNQKELNRVTNRIFKILSH